MASEGARDILTLTLTLTLTLLLALTLMLTLNVILNPNANPNPNPNPNANPSPRCSWDFLGANTDQGLFWYVFAVLRHRLLRFQLHHRLQQLLDLLCRP